MNISGTWTEINGTETIQIQFTGKNTLNPKLVIKDTSGNEIASFTPDYVNNMFVSSKFNIIVQGNSVILINLYERWQKHYIKNTK